MASNAENVSIWWRHHVIIFFIKSLQHIWRSGRVNTLCIGGTGGCHDDNKDNKVGIMTTLSLNVVATEMDVRRNAPLKWSEKAFPLHQTLFGISWFTKKNNENRVHDVLFFKKMYHFIKRKIIYDSLSYKFSYGMYFQMSWCIVSRNSGTQLPPSFTCYQILLWNLWKPG